MEKITEKIIESLITQRERLIGASMQIDHNGLNAFTQKQNIDDKIAEVDAQISSYVINSKA